MRLQPLLVAACTESHASWHNPGLLAGLDGYLEPIACSRYLPDAPIYSRLSLEFEPERVAYTLGISDALMPASLSRTVRGRAGRREVQRGHGPPIERRPAHAARTHGTRYPVA